ncbi:MAG: hypothetical protein COB30_006640 [Ectothiorhodospiraceae bacterium]|nr:hypothetical protein [Ectothiorhodospiraceae bacterium]
MSLIKLLLLLSLGGMAYQYWQKGGIEFLSGTVYVSETGFVEIPKPANFNVNTVIVIAAKNCTKEAARRADKLVDELAQRGIPHKRAHRASFESFNPSLKRRLDSVMKGTLPIVLINSKGKSNPTLTDVLAEYHSIYE